MLTQWNTTFVHTVMNKIATVYVEPRFVEVGETVQKYSTYPRLDSSKSNIYNFNYRKNSQPFFSKFKIHITLTVIQTRMLTHFKSLLKLTRWQQKYTRFELLS